MVIRRDGLRWRRSTARPSSERTCAHLRESVRAKQRGERYVRGVGDGEIMGQLVRSSRSHQDSESYVNLRRLVSTNILARANVH